MLEDKPLIIGITGAFGSGKSNASSFFALQGLTKIVLSSFLEEEAKKRGIGKITRKVLQDIGNEWRKKYGKGILTEKALSYLKEKKIARAVFDGIRNVGEIQELRQQKNFILLAIIADRKIRLERLKKLKRREDLTESLFNKLDRRDLGLGQKETGLQVVQCIRLADVIIDNNSSLNEFEKKLNNFLENLNKQ